MIDKLFLCVGAQKAGTTWLYSQLEGHKDISFSDVKEVHYFNTIINGSILLTRRKVDHLERLIKNNRPALEKYFSDLSSGRKVDDGIKRLLSPVDNNWYVNLFSKKSSKYAADFSPEYALIGKDGFDLVKKVSHDQKIIFMMRDPVARAMSAIKYYYKMRGEEIADIKHDELVKLASSGLILNMSKYEKTIQDLKSSFLPENVCYMFYEDVMRDKQKAIDSVCAFLDIERVYIPEEKLNSRVNVTERFDLPAVIEKKLLEDLSSTYDYLDKEFSLPREWNNG